jgi:hypothetical protein
MLEEIVQVEVELEAVVKMPLEVANHQAHKQMVEQDYKVILMEIIIIMLAEAQEVLGQVGLVVMEELEAEEVVMVPVVVAQAQAVVLPEILVVTVKMYQTMEYQLQPETVELTLEVAVEVVNKVRTKVMSE